MDLISRQAAIRWVKTECNPYGNPTLDFESGKKVIEHLEQMPSAEPERKKGRWERHYSRPNVFADLFWHCSCCGYKNENQYANVYHKFCPNCGEPMEVKKDDN